MKTWRECSSLAFYEDLKTKRKSFTANGSVAAVFFRGWLDVSSPRIRSTGWFRQRRVEQWIIELCCCAEKISPSLQLLPLSSIKVINEVWLEAVWSGILSVCLSVCPLRTRLRIWSVTLGQEHNLIRQFTVFYRPTKKFQVTFLSQETPELLPRGKTGMMQPAGVSKLQMLHLTEILWLLWFQVTIHTVRFSGKKCCIISVVVVLLAVKKQIFSPLHIYLFTFLSSLSCCWIHRVFKHQARV